MAMAKNAVFIIWLLSALAAGFVAVGLSNIRGWEWRELTASGKVVLPIVALLCATHALAFITYLFESLKAAGCK